MKSFILIPTLAIGALVLLGCEDDDNLHPGNESVEKAFTEKYPDATRIDWERKGDYWVVDFNRNANEMEAWFGSSGEWNMSETDLPYNSLPQAIKAAFSASEYQSWHVDDVDMIERNGMETVYVLEVEKGNQEYDLYYSVDGTLLKAVIDSHGNDDNGKYLPPTFSDKIKSYISTHYPQAKILETESERGMTEVDIIDGTTHRELVFNTSGEWQYTKTQIRKTAIPQTIQNVLNTSSYASYTIDDVYYYETLQRNYYYFDLDSRSQDVELIITSEGAIEVVKIEND